VRERALEQGGFRAHRQRERHARLQDRVALDHAAELRIEARAIERMRHLADEAARRFAQQPRIGIEGQHVAHALRNPRRASAAGGERGVGGAAQQPVELLQLAAFAFPPHPALLALAPDAFAMQEQEALAAGRRPVAAIQPRDAEHRDVEQRLVVAEIFSVRVDPVRQQREMQLVVGRGQIVDLEAMEIFLHRGAGAEQHRHRHQRAQLFRDACAQREARQAACTDAARDRAVDQCHRHVHGGNCPEHA
jgi:hypothetical protein